MAKYNVPSPRYTSYPTVPYWNPSPFSTSAYLNSVRETFQVSNSSEGSSLYIHLPYCESLCTYCSCNTHITVNHAVEIPYIDALLKEWSMYVAILEEVPVIREIHLGGGTPTFFAPEQLARLLDGIFSSSHRAEDAAFSFEGHPANTTELHLQTLYDRGFRRVSFGIQDFDSRVQTAIHRFQTVEEVAEITRLARQIGYTSINYDLIYGLPFQTVESLEKTWKQVLPLLPDRIAYYSYAYVPWLKPGQRKFTALDLPWDHEKYALYELGKKIVLENGYQEIGMDHFALPHDELSEAAKGQALHRNFMGYTTRHTRFLIGLGVSSISDSWLGFAQNEKTVEAYLKKINSNQWPFFRGHILTNEDLILRSHILRLMCMGETSWKEPEQQCAEVVEARQRLLPLQEDGLLTVTDYSVQATASGKPYLRNIAMAFDARLWQQRADEKQFSQTI
jgi:oxygen-independent coproporphyrinogen-3 oxidase